MKLSKFSQFFEAKSDYIIYHSSYTSAVQEVEAYAVKNGYTLDDEQMAQDIGLGPAKPKNGKTNKFHLDIYKGDKLQKKKLQVQIYGDEGRFELNMYVR